jgi:hypothetical protein
MGKEDSEIWTTTLALRSHWHLPPAPIYYFNTPQRSRECNRDTRTSKAATKGKKDKIKNSTGTFRTSRVLKIEQIPAPVVPTGSGICNMRDMKDPVLEFEDVEGK